jgi:hypothetical protein
LGTDVLSNDFIRSSTVSISVIPIFIIPGIESFVKMYTFPKIFLLSPIYTKNKVFSTIHFSYFAPISSNVSAVCDVNGGIKGLAKQDRRRLCVGMRRGSETT